MTMRGFYRNPKILTPEEKARAEHEALLAAGFVPATEGVACVRYQNGGAAVFYDVRLLKRPWTFFPGGVSEPRHFATAQSLLRAWFALADSDEN